MMRWLAITRLISIGVVGAVLLSAGSCSSNSADQSEQPKVCSHVWFKAASGETRCKTCGEYKSE